MTDTTYNGWKNYETWNVALWIDNDQFWYGVAEDCQSYADFVNEMIFTCGVESTPDGVDLNDDKIDTVRLTEMLEELYG